MANSEHLLISKVLQTNEISEVLESGIKPDHFSSAYQPMWLWILNYWREYKTVPTERAFKTEFGDYQIVDVSSEPVAALVDELHASYRYHHIVSAITAAMPFIDKHDVNEAIKHLTEGLQIAASETSRLRDIDIIQNWEERILHYEEIRKTPNSLRGIPTGFVGLDRITAGLRPQQLVTFVGEAKKGKSIMNLFMANSAHQHGVSPLFVSFEMSNEEQQARYDALVSGVSHTKIIRGDLTNLEMEKIKKALQQRKNMHPFYFSEDTTSLTTVSSLAAKIQQLRPAIVFVDGVYMMDDELGEQPRSPQALTNITRGLKKLAQRFDIPIVGTTQVLAWKLSNKKTRQLTGDSIGYSSSFVQDSDLVLGVESDPDIDNQSIVRVLLARTAPKGEIRIKWDWDKMDFTEVDEDNDNDNDNWYY